MGSSLKLPCESVDTFQPYLRLFFFFPVFPNAIKICAILGVTEIQSLCATSGLSLCDPAMN